MMKLLYLAYLYNLIRLEESEREVTLRGCLVAVILYTLQIENTVNQIKI